MRVAPTVSAVPHDASVVSESAQFKAQAKIGLGRYLHAASGGGVDITDPLGCDPHFSRHARSVDMIDAALERLQTDAWRTSGARYNASRRLQRRDFFSTVSMALFSAATVAAAFCQKVYTRPGSQGEEFLTTAIVCIGIFLLAISLIEWGSASGAKAESLHRSAEDLNAFHRRVGLYKDRNSSIKDVTWNDVKNLLEEYEQVKNRSSQNHKPIDDALFVSANRRAPEFKGKNISAWKAWSSKVLWVASSLWFMLILWFLIVAFLLAAFLMNPVA